MGRGKRLCTLALMLAGLACAAPPVAGADKVKIGSDLTRANDTMVGGCAVVLGCTGLQQALSEAKATLPLRSPVNGVVTGWSLRSSDDGATYSLRILRPTAGSSFAAAGTIAGTYPVAVGPEVTVSYPASMPIAMGDAIGVTLGAGATGLPLHSGTSGAGEQIYSLTAPLVDGGPAAAFSTTASRELLLQARITYCKVPPVKRKKVKKSKTLITGGDCTFVVIRKPVKKPKKVGRVLGQSPAAATTAAPGSVVTITVGKRTHRRHR